MLRLRHCNESPYGAELWGAKLHRFLRRYSWRLGGQVRQREARNFYRKLVRSKFNSRGQGLATSRVHPQGVALRLRFVAIEPRASCTIVYKVRV